MNKKNIDIYFSDGEGCLLFGNYRGADNEIDDFQMEQLESWAKYQTSICEIVNSDGERWYIQPRNIGYINIYNE